MSITLEDWKRGEPPEDAEVVVIRFNGEIQKAPASDRHFLLRKRIWWWFDLYPNHPAPTVNEVLRRVADPAITTDHWEYLRIL